ncbi:MarR family winged helix-turn-helix transcriptional regulator [Pseudonocardia endophytica]|uniref:DNA-binding MarR family transcriptional regulator n=1 Tax=Pseudonocardia endophytica TaxID=401976 RepID=A0A4V2PHI2_PSEEN|nr:MarR family transcriptional regulator [Pseudonocardia endophytica]TCK20826.1 DNA-binding MarR family transcriptional regulator [Pseudonocardia endophytica]
MSDQDPVDRLVDQWRRERPDLDDEGLDAMATIGRLGRLAAVAGPLVDRVFARHGLRTGEFDVLAALRRSGEPFVLTPSELARMMMLSAAAMTNRLDRLEAAGHVDRRLDPDNRRSILVSLTASGRALVDEVVTEHVRNERDLLSTLDRADRRALDDLLRRLLAGLEKPPGT